MRRLVVSQPSGDIHSWSGCSHCGPCPQGSVTGVRDDHRCQAASTCCPRHLEGPPNRKSHPGVPSYKLHERPRGLQHEGDCCDQRQ